jgi:pimeloyl-ACP methyl ester carboxylesterase
MPKALKSTRGIEMHYEISGTGSPLVLIPGGMMTLELMSGLTTALARTRQVVAVEPQAHGRTADIEREMTYEDMADDVAALLESLELIPADVCGFSVGAGIALQTAIRHPARVRKLVFLSGVFKGDGEYPQLRAITSQFSAEHPMLASLRGAYVKAAGSDAGWPALVEKMRLLINQPYDWSSDVAALTHPTLIVAADSDTFPVAHAVEMFRLLGGETAATAMGPPGRAQLAVLPGTNHFSFLQRLDLLTPIVSAFLDASPAGPPGH